MTADRISRNLTGLLLVGGLAAIATAWGFQLIGGYVPCKLCLEQRIPYYVGLPLALLALFLMQARRTGLALALLLVVAAVFAYGSGLGIYQSGAERHDVFIEFKFRSPNTRVQLKGEMIV